MKTPDTIKICFLFFSWFSTFVPHVSGQAPPWAWAKAMGSTAINDVGQAIVADASGNLYTTGYFHDTVDFNPGSGVFNLISAGSRDIFVLKTDPTGNFIWAKQIGGIKDDEALAMSFDKAGYICITGRYHETCDFDPGPAKFELWSASPGATFITKLDTAGTFVWAKSIGGGLSLNATSIANDRNGNVFITGNFVSTIDFDPDAATFNLYSWTFDIFILKLSSSGLFTWVKRIEGSNRDEAHSVAVDETGCIYTTGYFRDTADFDPGAGTYTFIERGNSAIFVSKLDSNGSFVWAKMLAGTNVDHGAGIALDKNSNVYCTGYFMETADFDPGPQVVNLTSKGDYDIFVCKLSANGELVWAKSVGGTEGDFAYAIGVDPLGNCYATGYFIGSIDFDPGPGVFNVSSGTGGYHTFIWKLTSSGNLGWAKASTQSDVDIGNSICVGPAGRVCVTGTFAGNKLFLDTIVLINQDISSNAGDIFIAVIDDSKAGIAPAGPTHYFSIYPNPANDRLSIELTATPTNFIANLYDSKGCLILSEHGTQHLDMNTSGLLPGIYILRLRGSDFIETRKLIITSKD